jgi:hypothetical protein
MHRMYKAHLSPIRDDLAWPRLYPACGGRDSHLLGAPWVPLYPGTAQ